MEFSMVENEPGILFCTNCKWPVIVGCPHCGQDFVSRPGNYCGICSSEVLGDLVYLEAVACTLISGFLNLVEADENHQYFGDLGKKILPLSVMVLNNPVEIFSKRGLESLLQLPKVKPKNQAILKLVKKDS